MGGYGAPTTQQAANTVIHISVTISLQHWILFRDYFPYNRTHFAILIVSICLWHLLILPQKSPLLWAYFHTLLLPYFGNSLEQHDANHPWYAWLFINRASVVPVTSHKGSFLYHLCCIYQLCRASAQRFNGTNPSPVKFGQVTVTYLRTTPSAARR